MMHDYMYIEVSSKHVQNLLKKIVQRFMLEKLRTKFTKKNRSEFYDRKVTYKISLILSVRIFIKKFED